MSDFFLFTISLAVTVLGLVGSLGGRAAGAGLASGLRGAAWSLVPLGAYLTGLTKFLSDLVFSPVKWAGVVVLGLGGVLYVTSGRRCCAGARAAEVDAGESPPRAPARRAGGRHAPKPRSRSARRPPTRTWPRSRRSSRTAASAVTCGYDDDLRIRCASVTPCVHMFTSV